MIVWTFDLAFGSAGVGDGLFGGINGVAVDAAGTAVYVSDDVESRIQRFDANGNFVYRVNPTPGLSDTFNVAVSPVNGDLFAADQTGTRIVQWDSANNYIRTFSTTFGEGIVKVGSDGKVYVLDINTNIISKFSSSGTLETASWLTGVDRFDTSLSDGALWVRRTSDNHYLKYDSNANQLADIGTLVGGGNFGVGDQPGYCLYFGTSGAAANIRIYNQSGVAQTIIGGPGSGPGQFNHMLDLQVRAGKLWVVDRDNFRVQRWSFVDASLESGAFVIAGRGAC